MTIDELLMTTNTFVSCGRVAMYYDEVRSEWVVIDRVNTGCEFGRAELIADAIEIFHENR